MRKICKMIKKAKNIALFSHENPDPDTIGSTIALGMALSKMGKKISYFCESEMPENYMFLDCAKLYNKDDIKSNFDLFISVDVADDKMLGKYQEDFLLHKNSIRIDHHLMGKNFAKTNYVVGYSACSIIIFEMLNLMKFKITSEIATSIYFAICGDTGIFRNNNTDSYTFEICSKLLKLGAQIRKVYSEFFDKKTVPYVKMTSKILLDAKINDEQKYVILKAKKEDYEKFNVSESDNFGNVPHTYLNCGYKIAAVLKEKDDGIHCSFRSKFEYDVSIIANKFGGGGHKNASGCKLETDLITATKLVEDEIQNYLKEEF